ncbi:hypothetical protein TREMEDRAFT_61618 [Tremella mesenterica DSM 1558]|uniref:uncharacterized protein n=1 Tax=Tremella mesenterica (strain ATCC 24925 / CBS 8224 / DSM 1558 / NBRC 9311 / NRRL Y-6157 / RJB 2259-6 / UBC 559-6) TaxID=578456 RepID=UPI0003F48DE2|nr:uncharacterized protein TREMEDRAFT_61618 [Tremella mesenterica DSM 1558]EIW69848.1 hypothetical protein TREMEDRAFT_61618 [Tremella mesenterica DSM 1558]
MSEHVSKSFDAVPKLLGKENFVQWKQRITIAFALTRSASFIVETAHPPHNLTSTDATELKANSDWIERDHQIAAGILSTCSEDIIKSHIHLIDAVFPRSYKIYCALTSLYGTSGAQYSFALGRVFLDSKCEDGGDVEGWVNQTIGRYRELKTLDFDLDQLCVNVLLNGLPERFGSYLDQVWTSSENPTIENVRLAILRINAGQLARANESTALSTQTFGEEAKQGASLRSMWFDCSLGSGLSREGASWRAKRTVEERTKGSSEQGTGAGAEG